MPVLESEVEVNSEDFKTNAAAMQAMVDEFREIESRGVKAAEAKRERDFARADEIRDELSARGIAIEDGPDGTTWRRLRDADE